jgi:hypothetical protein
MEGQDDYGTRGRGRRLAKFLGFLSATTSCPGHKTWFGKRTALRSAIGLNRPGKADTFNLYVIFIDLSVRHNLAFSVH